MKKNIMLLLLILTLLLPICGESIVFAVNESMIDEETIIQGGTDENITIDWVKYLKKIETYRKSVAEEVLKENYFTELPFFIDVKEGSYYADRDFNPGDELYRYGYFTAPLVIPSKNEKDVEYLTIGKMLETNGSYYAKTTGNATSMFGNTFKVFTQASILGDDGAYSKLINTDSNTNQILNMLIYKSVKDFYKNSKGNYKGKKEDLILSVDTYGNIVTNTGELIYPFTGIPGYFKTEEAPYGQNIFPQTLLLHSYISSTKDTDGSKEELELRPMIEYSPEFFFLRKDSKGNLYFTSPTSGFKLTDGIKINGIITEEDGINILKEGQGSLGLQFQYGEESLGTADTFLSSEKKGILPITEQWTNTPTYSLLFPDEIIHYETLDEVSKLVATVHAGLSMHVHNGTRIDRLAFGKLSASCKDQIELAEVDLRADKEEDLLDSALAILHGDEDIFSIILGSVHGWIYNFAILPAKFNYLFFTPNISTIPIIRTLLDYGIMFAIIALFVIILIVIIQIIQGVKTWTDLWVSGLWAFLSIILFTFLMPIILDYSTNDIALKVIASELDGAAVLQRNSYLETSKELDNISNEYLSKEIRDELKRTAEASKEQGLYIEARSPLTGLNGVDLNSYFAKYLDVEQSELSERLYGDAKSEGIIAYDLYPIVYDALIKRLTEHSLGENELTLSQIIFLLRTKDLDNVLRASDVILNDLVKEHLILTKTPYFNKDGTPDRSIQKLILDIDKENLKSVETFAEISKSSPSITGLVDVLALKLTFNIHDALKTSQVKYTPNQFTSKNMNTNLILKDLMLRPSHSGIYAINSLSTYMKKNVGILNNLIFIFFTLGMVSYMIIKYLVIALLFYVILIVFLKEFVFTLDRRNYDAIKGLVTTILPIILINLILALLYKLGFWFMKHGNLPFLVDDYGMKLFIVQLLGSVFLLGASYFLSIIIFVSLLKSMWTLGYAIVKGHLAGSMEAFGNITTSIGAGLGSTTMQKFGDKLTMRGKTGGALAMAQKELIISSGTVPNKLGLDMLNPNKRKQTQELLMTLDNIKEQHKTKLKKGFKSIETKYAKKEKNKRKLTDKLTNLIDGDSKLAQKTLKDGINTSLSSSEGSAISLGDVVKAPSSLAELTLNNKNAEAVVQVANSETLDQFVEYVNKSGVGSIASIDKENNKIVLRAGDKRTVNNMIKDFSNSKLTNIKSDLNKSIETEYGQVQISNVNRKLPTVRVKDIVEFKKSAEELGLDYEIQEDGIVKFNDPRDAANNFDKLAGVTLLDSFKVKDKLQLQKEIQTHIQQENSKLFNIEDTNYTVLENKILEASDILNEKIDLNKSEFVSSGLIDYVTKLVITDENAFKNALNRIKKDYNLTNTDIAYEVSIVKGKKVVEFNRPEVMEPHYETLAEFGADIEEFKVVKNTEKFKELINKKVKDAEESYLTEDDFSYIENKDGTIQFDHELTTNFASLDNTRSIGFDLNMAGKSVALGAEILKELGVTDFEETSKGFKNIVLKGELSKLTEEEFEDQFISKLMSKFGEKEGITQFPGLVFELYSKEAASQVVKKLIIENEALTQSSFGLSEDKKYIYFYDGAIDTYAKSISEFGLKKEFNVLALASEVAASEFQATLPPTAKAFRIKNFIFMTESGNGYASIYSKLNLSSNGILDKLGLDLTYLLNSAKIKGTNLVSLQNFGSKIEELNTQLEVELNTDEKSLVIFKKAIGDLPRHLLSINPGFNKIPLASFLPSKEQATLINVVKNALNSFIPITLEDRAETAAFKEKLRASDLKLGIDYSINTEFSRIELETEAAKAFYEKEKMVSQLDSLNTLYAEKTDLINQFEITGMVSRTEKYGVKQDESGYYMEVKDPLLVRIINRHLGKPNEYNEILKTMGVYKNIISETVSRYTTLQIKIPDKSSETQNLVLAKLLIPNNSGAESFGFKYVGRKDLAYEVLLKITYAKGKFKIAPSKGYGEIKGVSSSNIFELPLPYYELGGEFKIYNPATLEYEVLDRKSINFKKALNITSTILPNQYAEQAMGQVAGLGTQGVDMTSLTETIRDYRQYFIYRHHMTSGRLETLQKASKRIETLEAEIKNDKSLSDEKKQTKLEKLKIVKEVYESLTVFTTSQASTFEKNLTNTNYMTLQRFSSLKKENQIKHFKTVKEKVKKYGFNTEIFEEAIKKLYDSSGLPIEFIIYPQLILGSGGKLLDSLFTKNKELAGLENVLFDYEITALLDGKVGEIPEHYKNLTNALNYFKGNLSSFKDFSYSLGEKKLAELNSVLPDNILSTKESNDKKKEK